MQERHFGCLLVTAGVKLAGIITERDILNKALGKGRSPDTIPVEEIMTPDPESFHPEDSVASVMNAMYMGGYRHTPVVDEQNVPLAVISVKDIIGFIVENFPEEILNLPPKSSGKPPQQDGG